MHESGDGYTTSMGCAARMIIPGRAWNLCRPGITVEYLGMNRYPWSNGNNGVGTPSTVTTHKMAALAMTMPGAVSVAGPAIMIGRLDTAVFVAPGPAPNT
eukprot:665802-Amphidinium_carterae.1